MQILALLALLFASLSAVVRTPLWIPVFLLALIEALRNWP